MKNGNLDNALKDYNKLNENNFSNEFNLKSNKESFYGFINYNLQEKKNTEEYLIEKINKQNDDYLLEREMMGNIKKRFGVNKIKQKFDEERKVRSIIKNKALEGLLSVRKNNDNFPKRFSSDVNIDRNLILNFNSKNIKTKNSSVNNILNSRNEESSAYYLDSPPPNINLNKMPVTSNKFCSSSDIERTISGSSINNQKNSQKTLSSTINVFNKKNTFGKQAFDSVTHIQRNKTGNQFLKSNTNNFYDIMNSNINKIETVNSNLDVEEYFNLMNLNHHNLNEDNSATDTDILNKYLGNNVQENSNKKNNKDINNKSQNHFYESPNKKNQSYNATVMRNLEVLKKLAFKDEPNKIIYEKEDTDYY